MTLSIIPNSHVVVKLWVETFTGNARFDGPTYFSLEEYGQLERSRTLKMLDQFNSGSIQFKLARLWYDNCCKNHGCAARLDSRFVPTRLVEILSTPTLDQLEWRVSATSEIPRTNISGFITVSHRWDSRITAKLTRENMAQLRSFRPVSYLPQNFQTAISIAKHLGISYLWVDSLCIIQDSQQDWAKESLVMKDVYQQSSLNIVIGLTAQLSSERKVLSDPAVCRLNWEMSFWDSILLRPFRQSTRSRRFCITYADFWNHSVYDTELSDRAWIFQELMLSSRTLHLYDSQIIWECGALKACEMFPDGVPSKMMSSTDSKHTMSDFYRNIYEKSWTRDTVIERSWCSAVNRYSALELSFECDKLVAFAGIAKFFHSLHPDCYHGGIFRRHMPRHLLWWRVQETAKAITKSTRPSVFRAPSWSWAAIDAPIHTSFQLQGHSETVLAPIIEVQTSPVGEDHFGQVRDGRIILSGWLMLVTFPQTKAVKQLKDYQSLPRMILGETSNAIFDVEEDDIGQDRLFLPLTFVDTEGESKLNRDYKIFGLLLSPIPSGERTQFTRVGYLSRSVPWEHVQKEEFSALGFYRNEYGNTRWRRPTTPQTEITIV
ncbi:hypothetical protein MMC11_003097 [Xylographa trunciseda]|nr:hypothetical protein [Xylographa trunciseda]